MWTPPLNFKKRNLIFLLGPTLVLIALHGSLGKSVKGSIREIANVKRFIAATLNPPTPNVTDFDDMSRYFCSNLTEPSEDFKAGNNIKALNKLNSIKPPYPVCEVERRYLRAMCLQSLGRFRESGTEYNYVANRATDDQLVEKAKEGARLSQSHIRKVTKNMTSFGSIPTNDSAGNF